MRHVKTAQLETAPTKHGDESVYLFLVFTIIGHCKSAQLETAPTKYEERKCLFIFGIHRK